MFPPIISLMRGHGITFLPGLGVDIPAYNFFNAWARHKISSWPGGRCSAYNSPKAWARHKFHHSLGVNIPEYNLLYGLGIDFLAY